MPHLEFLKAGEIEGERSTARSAQALRAARPEIIEMILDPTTHYREPLTEEQLFACARGAVP